MKFEFSGQIFEKNYRITNDIKKSAHWEARCSTPAEILGSNPTGGMDICLLWVSCVVR